MTKDFSISNIVNKLLLNEASYGYTSLQMKYEEIEKQVQKSEDALLNSIEKLKIVELNNLCIELVNEYFIQVGRKKVLDPNIKMIDILNDSDLEIEIRQICENELKYRSLIENKSEDDLFYNELYSECKVFIENVLTNPSDKVKKGQTYSTAIMIKSFQDNEKNYLNLKKQLRSYDPEEFEYEFDVDKQNDNDNDNDEYSKKHYDINEFPRKVWISWPKFVSHISYGSQKSSEGESANIAAVGPGEERIAAIFGGQVQGGSVSYDVVTHGKPSIKWEIKALTSKSDQIRPGTEGINALEEAKDKIDRICKQIREFNIQVNKNNVLESLDDQSYGYSDSTIKNIKFVISACDNFIKHHYDMIVSKSEISNDRFLKLQRILNLLNRLITFIYKNENKKENKEYTINIGDKKTIVDKKTYVELIHKLGKTNIGTQLFSDVSKLELALSVFQDIAFDNPEEFFNQWNNLVKASDVFRKVNGLIVVNKDLGFNIVDKQDFDLVFKFVNVSQVRPKFIFTEFDSQQINFEEFVNDNK